MLKKRIKCAGEACLEKVENIVAVIAGVAFSLTLIFVYASLGL